MRSTGLHHLTNKELLASWKPARREARFGIQNISPMLLFLNIFQTMSIGNMDLLPDC